MGVGWIGGVESIGGVDDDVQSRLRDDGSVGRHTGKLRQPANPSKFRCALRAIKPETSFSGHILVRDKMKHQLTWGKRTGQVLRFEIFQGVFKVASSS